MDRTHDLVPRGHRQDRRRGTALDFIDFRVADSTGVNPDQHLARSRFGDVQGVCLQRRARFLQLPEVCYEFVDPVRKLNSPGTIPVNRYCRIAVWR